MRYAFHVMCNLVTIGGGSGQYALLSGLRDLEKIKVTSIVSMVDSGGSTGRLRDELGILPPGDILKCILALSPDREIARKILQARFKGNNNLKGHNSGNLLLTILSQYAGSFPDAVKALGEILNIQGTVLPVTLSKATLVAELTDGSYLYGEAAIDVPRGDQREKIKNTFLVPHHCQDIKAYPQSVEAIKKADYIIIGPGDIYTSIIPNFLVKEIKKEIKKSKAKLIYIVNIMTKFGETDNFKSIDFIKEIEDSIGRNLNIIIFNNKLPSKDILKNYKKQKSYFVKDGIKLKNRKILSEDLLDVAGGIIRHNSEKLSKVIKQII